MSRYVDLDELIEYAEKRKLQGIPVDVIKSKATADVEKVRRGEWVHGREIRREYIGDALINIYYEDFTCSCCRYMIDDKHYSRILYKRCPECGAHMMDGHSRDILTGARMDGEYNGK